MSETDTKQTTPILLLKTKSTPHDGYEEHFSNPENDPYRPIFVPVLEHYFRDDALKTIRGYMESGGFNISDRIEHGAIIFTSQRAVEAFAKVVGDLRNADLSTDDLFSADTPLYVVGPATARGLRALGLKCPILGEESGNGEVLAGFILEDYNRRHPGDQKPPILFLVGEQRRDIIPRTLQNRDLPLNQRNAVHELVVYETGEMASFKLDFSRILEDHKKKGINQQWVVVFSPTGCKAMLETLNLLDPSTGRFDVKALTESQRRRETMIATIGPTTRDYLVKEFGIHPDVCAAKPSPEGVGNSIKDFMVKIKNGGSMP